MKIRCKLEREGGTPVTLDETEYRFVPDANGAHVAEVKDKAHVARLLAIPEAYEIYDEEEAANAKKAAPTSGETTGTDPYAGLTRAQLDDAHKEKFGKKPSPRTKDETVIAALKKAHG